MIKSLFLSLIPLFLVAMEDSTQNHSDDIPLANQKLEFCQNQRSRFSPIEAASYPIGRNDAERTKSRDADEGKNQLLKYEGCGLEAKGCTIIGSKHVEGTGIGYHQGYTTFGGFLLFPRCFKNLWSPYLDLRGHVFNNGKWASNVGLGMRYLDSIAWGANIYYDYRNTTHYHYNQMGVGVEATGRFWNITLNGYLPVGRKKSPFFDRRINDASVAAQFSRFSGNNIVIKLPGTEALYAKEEFAFKGMNASATFRILQKNSFSIDLGAGPYYFNGSYRTHALGGQGSLSLQSGDYISLSVTGSYDRIFRGRLQGAVSFSVPLWPKGFGKKCKKPCSSTPSFYNDSLTRGARRNEMIVLDTHETLLAAATEGGLALAINPLTGQPYTVWFVNNTSSSNGTYESPYPTLLEAQTASTIHDLIYVFPGDGTNTGMDSGILLKDNQQLLGSGAAVALTTTEGAMIIPAQTTNKPLITNAGSTAVHLANSNVLSGLQIGLSSTGVAGSSISNLEIFSCQIDESVLAIDLNQVTGNVTISNNMFTEYTNQGIQIISTTGSCTQRISNNTFSAMNSAPNTYGITTNLSGTSHLSIDILNSAFSEHTNTSISLFSSDHSVLNPTLSNNTITAPGGVGGTIGIAFGPGGISSLALITGNTLSNHTGNSLNITADSAVAFTSTISNNTFQGIAGTSTKGISMDTTNGSSAIWSTTVSGNTCAGGFTQADIYLDPRGTSMLTSATLSNNTTIGDLGATSPFGIQLDADDTATVMSLQITNNQSRNHTSSEISVSSRGSATQVTTNISNNTLLTTGGLATGNGIQLYSTNASGITGIVSGNRITDMHNIGISIFANDAANANATISSNILKGPSGVINTNGISFNSNSNADLSISITNNFLQNFSALSIYSYVNDASTVFSTISANTIIGERGTSQKAIALASATGATGSWSTTINNNIITGGFTQADIYLDPQGTATLTSAVVKGNTTIGPDDGSAPFGIQLDADEGSTVTSLLIENNTSANHASSEIIVTARGTSAPSITTTISNNSLPSDTVTTQNLIFLNAINNGTINGTISNNTCTGTSITAMQASSSHNAVVEATITGNTCSNYASNGISINSSQSAGMTAPISNNTVTTAATTSAGITLNISDSSTMDTTISSNTISHHETQSIGINFFADTLICSIENNNILIGSTTGNAFGILTNLGGAAQTVEITGNTLLTEAGGLGSQFGIVCPQQSTSGTPKAISITNNIVTDCGNAPAAGAPLTGGIVVALINTDSVFFNCNSNTTTNCGIGPEGQGGMIGARLNFGAGTPGHYCWALHNCNSNTDFSLVNDPPAGTVTDYTLDSSGNTGTVIPYMGSPFSIGSCP